MKVTKFIISLLITITLIILLNLSIAGNPAFGKLLNPVSGFWNNAESKDLYLPSEISNLDLKEEATVYFDDNRIPHIFANNEHDLYFMQGYVVASLRMWQLEFQVLAAEGRIAELLGNDPKYLAFDKMQRKKGLKWGAQNKVKSMESEPLAKELLGAYTDGINAYINQLKPRDLPLEYKLIGYKPEPWSIYKTALFLMNMSEVLTSTEYDVENSNFIFQYGSDLFHKIHKDWYPELDPVIATPKEGWLAHLGIDTSNLEKDTILKIPAKKLENDIEEQDLSNLPKKTDVQIGSNNWVLSGGKTASAYPLLANDPHLRLTFPSVWMEMHLVGPQSNTYGVAFPGSPSIIIGFNEKIGWGVTNVGRDVKDWYIIEYKDESRNEYKWKDGWRKTEKIIEEFKVKGGKTAYDTIIITHLGPVVHENHETKAGNVNLAVQWTAHFDSEEYKTFYLLNRASNFEQYLEALKHYECPAQNFAFASIDGDIALRQQGKYPILEKYQGLTVQDGSQKEAWSEFIPFDHINMMYNPERGFVSSANQHGVDTTYPYYTNGVFEYYRNRVINEELSKMKRATVEDMKKLQYNNYNLLAAENLPMLMKHLSTFKMTFKEQEVFEILEDWDFETNKESLGATYFQIFYETFYTTLWDEFTEEEVAGGWENFTHKDGFKAPNEFLTYKMIMDSVEHPFLKNEQYPEIETMEDLVKISFSKAVEKIDALDKDNIEWGKYKNTLIEHLAMIPAFSKNINTGGNYKVVNATGKYHGPSWRMILDFADGNIKGIGVYPGGQSGNPGSPYYDNFVESWMEGDFHELFNSNKVEDYENEKFKKVTFKVK